MLSLIKNHKVISCLVLSVCLIGVVGAGTAFGLHQAKIANTQKALQMAKDGYVDAEELEQLGDLALGEEVVAEDGSVVVVTKDANGNYQTTTVKDAEGHNTGAVVPGGGTGGGGEYTPSPTPTPSGHTHTWVAHYATRQVPQTQEIYHPAVTHKESHDYCNECNGCVDDCGFHTHNGIMASTYAKVTTVVDQAAWTETVTTYVTEQYIDYYYCSECGERQ